MPMAAIPIMPPVGKLEAVADVEVGEGELIVVSSEEVEGRLLNVDGEDMAILDVSKATITRVGCTMEEVLEVVVCKVTR